MHIVGVPTPIFFKAFQWLYVPMHNGCAHSCMFQGVSVAIPAHALWVCQHPYFFKGVPLARHANTLILWAFHMFFAHLSLSLSLSEQTILGPSG